MKGVFIVLIVMGLAGPAAAQAPGPLGAVREITLRNGLRLILAPDSASTALDVAVWYNAGSTHDREGRTGISHLFEHLMFRGSAHYGPQEHSRLVQAEGGAANANTTSDFTCFYETLPRVGLELAFRLEADRMATLALTQENLDAERRIVSEERRWRTRTNPVGEALQQLQSLAYTSHPYRWPIIGLAPDLDRITLKDCQEYFRSHYAPNNAVVTVVGDFDPQQALALAQKTLERVPRRLRQEPKLAPEPVQTAARETWQRADVLAPLCVVGWRTPPDSDPDTPAFEVLAQVLGNGPDSRLNRALVLERLSCLFTQASLDGRRDSGLLFAIAAVKPGADSTAVKHDLAEEVEKLGREPLGADELDRARRQLELATLFGWQTARNRARSLGTAVMVDDDWRAATRRLERLRALTPADVQRAAARVLRPAGRNLVWFAPLPAATTAVQGGR
jgi:zinc protease